LSEKKEDFMSTSKASRRQAIWPTGTPKPLMPYSPAIKAGNWVFVSGHLASDYIDDVAPEAVVNPMLPFHSDALELQSRYIMKNLKKTLEAAGSSMDQVVRIYQWLVAPKQKWQEGDAWTDITIERYLSVRDEFLHPPRPASTGMGIRELLVRNTIIEVDMIAIIPEKNEKIKGVTPPATKVPQPLAGYSMATKVGDWLFTCGEVPTDWKGDWMSSVHMGERSALAPEARVDPYHWYGVPIRKQTEYTLQKLAGIVEEAGSSLEHAVKATVYLAHPSDYLGFEEVWKSWFPRNPPARVIIPYMGLGPKGSRVEIAFKCIMPNGRLKKKTIETDKAPKPLGHEPQAVKAGNYLFFSSQMACNENGLAPEAQRDPRFPYYGSLAKMQMRYILKNVQAICEAAGTSLDNICRRQAFHTDFHDFQESIDEWAAHFSGDRPASTTLKIGGPLLVPGCEVLLDLIAYVPD
jgi:enamine deaminase RidA (YjgF/YER057c/UK114 family)